MRGLLLWAVLLVYTLPAAGQAPEIAGIFPAGGQAGVTARVRIDGKNLQGASLMVDGRGVHAESVKADGSGNQAIVTLSIARDAALGPHELRIGTQKGVSGPARFWVDTLPGLTAPEPTGDFAHAQTVPTTPVAINGRIGSPASRNIFAFDAHSGETWIFDCCAARIRSHLDPVLELHDEQGHLLRSAQAAWERDPRLIYRFVIAGRYFIAVRDTQFQGGPDFSYRLMVGPLPAITSFQPRGGRPGETIALSVQGVNLGSTTRCTVRIPADAAGEYWIAPQTANGIALPISLVIQDSAVSVTEDVFPSSFLPMLPATVDAVFLHSPTHSYRFNAFRGEHLIFEMAGWSLGSRVDGALRLLDAAGNELPGTIGTADKEPRIEYAVTKDGAYRLEARNVDEKTGADCYYRLSIRRRIPQIRLLLDTDRIHVGIGGSAVIAVRVSAPYGHPTAIALSAADLPPGLSCSGGRIAPDQETAEITLTARPDTTLGAATIRLRGVTIIDGNPKTLDVIAREQYMPRTIDPGMFQDDSYRRPYRDCYLLPLGVIARAEPFSLETGLQNVKLRAGQTAQLRVHAVRRSGANGEIKLELHGLPPKVTASTSSIPVDQSDATLTLTAAPDAPLAERTIVVVGHLDQATQPAPAVALTLAR